MKLKTAFIASFGVLLFGCGATQSIVANGVRSNSVQEQGDTRVGEYISSEWSLETASYWIEGPEGLVLQVRALIPAVHEKWAPSLFKKYWNGRYPRELVLADSFGDSTRELSAAGLTLKAHVLGTGCSPAHVVIEWEGHLFTGDLVARATHNWFENGRMDAWLQRLDGLRALKPKWIHPGRGMPGGPELLDAQTQYLQAVMEEVTAERHAAHPSSDPIATVMEKVTRRYPDHHYPSLLQALVRGEWSRQASRPPATAAP